MKHGREPLVASASPECSRNPGKGAVGSMAHSTAAMTSSSKASRRRPLDQAELLGG
jgi:hypothetical protein